MICAYCNKQFNIDTRYIRKVERRDNTIIETTCPYCNKVNNLYGEAKNDYNLSSDTLLSISKINEIEKKQIELLREYARLQKMKENYIKHVYLSNNSDINKLWYSDDEVVNIGLDTNNTTVRHYRSKKHI